MPATHASDPLARLDFLRRPESYPERPSAITVVETHFAWVFLTGRHAYKLKKPIRFGRVDLRSPEARRRSCEQELALNRRLAAATYLGVEALTTTGAGELVLGGSGPAVDWLVKMVQLPAQRMMDQLARRGEVTAADLEILTAKLVNFQRAAAAIDGTGFAAFTAAQLRQARDELLLSAAGLPAELVQRAAGRALRYLAGQWELFAERVAHGRVRELHGDLRPEHICLLPDPQIIDCLEFDELLRTLDCAQEAAFLAMECAALGDQAIGVRLLESYRRMSGDDARDDLVLFYLGERAIVRAMLSVRHLTDPAVTDRARWEEVSRRYLTLAAGWLDRIPDRLLAPSGD